MKVLFEFLPILLFFLVYKIAGIYWATSTAIVASLCQFALHWFKRKQIDTLQLITVLCIVLLGGATLSLHNELFIKWKPTAINWTFGLVFLASSVFGKKTLAQRLMESNVKLPHPIWHRLNLSWVLFFVFTGAANLYVVYHFSTEVWVNFKLFGLLGLTLLFVLAQSLYLMKHLKASTPLLSKKEFKHE
ncbi:MAG: septation protein A [Gammaproteobacteria bacterium]|nr:septation protein A [Gammaproteobacteria bacterium]